MPAFSFHLPRFLQSPSSRRSATSPRDDITDSSSALSSPPSSRRDGPEQDVLATTATSRSPVPSGQTHPQKSMDRLHLDRVQRNFPDQPSQAPRPITQKKVVDSAPKLSSCGLVAQQPAHLPCVPLSTDSIQSQQSLLPQHSPYSLTTASQQSLVLERQSQSSGKHQNRGMFHRPHNFSATGNFIDGNVGSVMYINTPSNQFMKDLLKETIPGAASDSSARYPPPRCHPGTRLAILERCLYFIAHCDWKKNMCWVVGAAGVGKSAIMQNVAESPKLPVTCNASVFFSINGRNDGTKAIMTLCYQFAAKSELYRCVIEDEITRDPSLLQSSMPIQFEKFIIRPFIHNPSLNSGGRVLIIVDGLDECNNPHIQVELLRLISNFCILYPSSPIAWLIASRPEAHITSFFSRAEVMSAYEKEEIQVDSNEARADVEQFLREKLTEIRKASDLLGPHWPDEQYLWKLAKAAGGLFAYAHTVIRYIGDSTIGDPASQLSDVLNVIDEHPTPDVRQEEHPMALLDALYARILSNVPSKIMKNTRKLLLALASNWDSALRYSETGDNFIVLCNWLGMTANEAYAAVNRLRCVLHFPQSNEAHKEEFKPFHKSFIDYIFRSRFSADIELEARQLTTQCTFRVLEEIPSGIGFGDAKRRFYYGILAYNRGASNKIPITWPASEGIDWDDKETRLGMYKLAIGEVAAGVERGVPEFQSDFCIGLLTTRFKEPYGEFPHYQLRNLVFDESRRHEFTMLGILKQIPVKAVGFRIEYYEIKLQFRRPVTTTTLFDPWNSSCKHKRTGQCEKGKEQNWTTTFDPDLCTFCIKRLEVQLKSWIIRSPDHAVPIMFTSMGECCVELRFVDPEDGVSEWTYWSWLELSSKERKKLGSTV